jgi:hypothetical protein
MDHHFEIKKNNAAICDCGNKQIIHGSICEKHNQEQKPLEIERDLEGIKNVISTILNLSCVIGLANPNDDLDELVFEFLGLIFKRFLEILEDNKMDYEFLLNLFIDSEKLKEMPKEVYEKILADLNKDRGKEKDIFIKNLNFIFDTNSKSIINQFKLIYRSTKK